MAYLIKAKTGEITEVIGAGQHQELTLQQLQEIIGGYIEVVGLSRPYYNCDHLYCNEDGKRLGLPFNELATMVTFGLGPWPDRIVGDVVIARRGTIHPEDGDIESF